MFLPTVNGAGGEDGSRWRRRERDADKLLSFTASALWSAPSRLHHSSHSPLRAPSHHNLALNAFIKVKIFGRKIKEWRQWSGGFQIRADYLGCIGPHERSGCLRLQTPSNNLFPLPTHPLPIAFPSPRPLPPATATIMQRRGSEATETLWHKQRWFSSATHT